METDVDDDDDDGAVIEPRLLFELSELRLLFELFNCRGFPSLYSIFSLLGVAFCDVDRKVTGSLKLTLILPNYFILTVYQILYLIS